MTALALILFATLPAGASVGARQAAMETGLRSSIHVKGTPVKAFPLAERMRALHVRGVSVAVIHKWKIDWAKGYGILDDGTRKPVNTETLFQAGSISKPVAVAGAMRLLELGKITSLDEDVNVKLKSWKAPENEFTRTEKVTLRRTMSHSAGLTIHGFPGYAAGQPVPTIPQILDGEKPANTKAVRVDTIPGTLGRYSGGGTTVMQLLMTDVTGQDFPALMRDLVLRKAGMRNSTYEQPVPLKLRGNTASGYHADGAPVAGKYHTYPEMAAAGLWTTATDLARFAIEMGLSRQGKSNRVLKRGTVEQMMTVQKDGFGLGFALATENGVRTFGHGGADEGFQALLTCTFDGDGLAVLVNSDNGARLAGEIERAVSAAYGWRHAKPLEKESIAMEAAALAAYEGVYQVNGGPTLTIKAENGGLLLRFPGAEFHLLPEAPDRFFAIEGGFPPLEFERDAQGSVSRVRVGRTLAPKRK